MKNIHAQIETFILFNFEKPIYQRVVLHQKHQHALSFLSDNLIKHTINVQIRFEVYRNVSNGINTDMLPENNFGGL